MNDKIPFSELVGKTLTGVVNDDNTRIVFTDNSGCEYALFHESDCCESVSVDDICGDLNDLIGEPLLMAEENSSLDPLPTKPRGEWDESYTWTFYRLATIKGCVVIKWYGTSNGYYSESVSFARL